MPSPPHGAGMSQECGLGTIVNLKATTKDRWHGWRTPVQLRRVFQGNPRNQEWSNEWAEQDAMASPPPRERSDQRASVARLPSQIKSLSSARFASSGDLKPRSNPGWVNLR